MLRRLIIFFLFLLSFREKVLCQKEDSCSWSQGQGFVDKAINFSIKSGLSQTDSIVHYLQKAAEAKHPEAYYLLGVSYLRGVHAKQNVSKGLALLSQGANCNHKMAIELLLEFYSDSSNKVYFNAEKAQIYAVKGTKVKSAPAYYFLGRFYAQKKEDSLAFEYMRYAADTLFFPKAQITLGEWYKSSSLYPQKLDLPTSLRYYELAYNNAKSTLEEKTEAKIGIYYCLQIKRFLHNLHFQLLFPLPEKAPQIQSIHFKD
jgi:TPR repeat protein